MLLELGRLTLERAFAIFGSFYAVSSCCHLGYEEENTQIVLLAPSGVEKKDLLENRPA